MAKDYLFHHRNSPVLFSIPHDGTFIPENIAQNMHEFALKTPDRDFFVSQLFSFAKDFDISLLQTKLSRYVIDMNRPPDNTPMYPGQSVPGLCPTSSFDKRELYKQAPDAKEIKRRISNYWQPYHQIIRDKLDLIKQQHGFAVLFDAHSIKSHVPRFFKGQLPDINIGTHSSQSCSTEMENKIKQILEAQNNYSFVFNERFKGGYITRHYGQPEQNIQAIQIEISQATYMDEENNRYAIDKAEKLKTLLIRLVNSLC